MFSESLKSTINEFLFVNYEIDGTLQRLPGENLNVLVETEKGERYVLKVVTSGAPDDSARMEDRLFGHVLREGFSLQLPTIIKSYNGALHTGINIPMIGPKQAYLMNYVVGESVDKKPDISVSLQVDSGRAMAQLDRALQGFDDPSAHLGHPWELPLAGRHRDKAQAINEPYERALVEWAFDLWASVSSRLPGLPHQVIHGDGNKENLLAEGDRVTGLVDFADACYNPRICELAVLLAYMMMDHADPMSVAQSVIRGYHEVLALEEGELDVLFPLVCGRLAVTVSIASARLLEDPDNPNWFVSQAPALDLLDRLSSIGGVQADQPG